MKTATQARLENAIQRLVESEDNTGCDGVLTIVDKTAVDELKDILDEIVKARLYKRL